MKESKTFRFLGVTVECLLTDTIPDGFSSDASGGVYTLPVVDDPTTFRVWFKGLVKDYVFVHECWHLFFAIMQFIDNRVHTMDELYEEIYAYSFQTLYSGVMEIITHMKLYKRFWDEYEKAEKVQSESNK